MASTCGPRSDANSESAAGAAASPSRSARSSLSAAGMDPPDPEIAGHALDRVGDALGGLAVAARRAPRRSRRPRRPAWPANCSSRLRKRRALPATRARPSAASTPSIAGRSAGRLAAAVRRRGTRRGLLPRLHPALERREQGVRVDRLGDVVVHAGVEAALALLHRGVRRHRDDRELREPRIRADLRRRLVAVHLGHLQVHQHDVVRRRRRPRPGASDGLSAVVGDRRRRAPTPSSSSTAICWLISLSSTSRIRTPPRRFGRRALARPAADLLGPRREDRHERVDQHRLRDGLQQEAVDVELLGLLAHLFAAERGDHDDRPAAS